MLSGASLQECPAHDQSKQKRYIFGFLIVAAQVCLQPPPVGTPVTGTLIEVSSVL